MGQPRLYGPEILHNGDLELGSVSSWYTSAASGASATLTANSVDYYSGSYSMLTTISSIGSGAWNVITTRQDLYPAKRLGQGFQYQLSFAAWAGTFTVKSFQVRIDTASGTSAGLQALTSVGSTSGFEYKSYIFTTSYDAQIIRFADLAQDYVDISFDAVSLRACPSFRPGYDYERKQTVQRRDLRARAGTLHTYVEPNAYTRFIVPLQWVSAVDRSLVNSWWESGTTLRWVENDDYPGSYYDVRITGTEEPFTGFHAPYGLTQQMGELVLETI